MVDQQGVSGIGVTDRLESQSPTLGSGVESDDDSKAGPATKPKGRGLALLGMLVALLASAGTGFVYYRLIYLEPLAPIAERLSVLEVNATARAEELRGLERAQIKNLESMAAQQSERLEQAQQAVVGALSAAANQASPAPREWKLAEVEYLLRIANHRVLMERDVDMALRLFSAADALLLQLDDFALHGVRAALADEILALRSIRGNDVQGIYLRLEAVKGRLVALPLELPESFVAASEPAARPTPGIWEAVSDEIGKYLKVRRFNGVTKPLLAPEEAVYLELNLRLMLERAQLAALRRQQLVYEQSLSAAQEWLLEYFDQDEPVVQDLVNEARALIGVNLEQALPDVSGSLSALLAVRWSAS